MGLVASDFEVFAHLIEPGSRPRIQTVVLQIVMTPDCTNTNESTAPDVSIAIFAWNEERTIQTTLRSLFQQSLFGELRRRGSRCEVICVTNGCTDQTALVASELMREVMLQNADQGALTARVADIAARGKVNAWNQFVHDLSAREAGVLFMMDADILIHRRETLWNMLSTLRQHPEATVAVDVPCKDIAFKACKSIADRLSLAASRMTLAADGQLCGQLYCIRARAARKIYLPKDLAACEDGFIKALVCTDFLSHAVWPGRIRVAPNAEHTFEAYTSPGSLLRNQKRQVMGQTIVHVLVDRYLKLLSVAERQDLAQSLRAKEAADPLWLKRLIHDHLQETRFFWRLHPGLLGNRFERLGKLGPMRRLACLPAAVAGSCLALAGSFMADRSLRRGCTDYWPKVRRLRFEQAARAQGEPLKPGSVSLGQIGG